MSEHNKNTLNEEPREQFSTTFGMVMAMIGAAVGLGNVWRFPYMVGLFGGGAFVIVFLGLVALIGVPVMVSEWAIGRHFRRGPLGALKKSGIPGGKLLGWVNFTTIFMATSYYSIIIGWALYYFVTSITGGLTDIHSGDFFNAILGNFGLQFVFTAIVVALVGLTLLLGVKNGIERVAKYTIPLLFVMMLVLFFKTMTLPNAMEGLRFYLVPDFSKINGGVILGALGQAFFTLCLGGTFMVVYGSYMSDKENLGKSALYTVLGDTFAGLFAGLIILPAAFSFGVELSSGPPLTFITVPEIFKAMPGGLVFMGIFFLLLFLAAYLSDIAAYEVLVSSLMDEFNWKRKKSIIFFCIAQLIVGIPSMISLDWMLKNDLLWGTTLQPFGSMVVVIALLWYLPRVKVVEELKKGSNVKIIPDWLFFWMKYVVPAAIAIILFFGVKDLFLEFFI